MAESNFSKKANDTWSKRQKFLTQTQRNENAIILNFLRAQREAKFHARNTDDFLYVSTKLPHLRLQLAGLPKAYSVEDKHLKDFCNKNTVIYCTGTQSGTCDFISLYRFIFKKWCPRDIHRFDIEFSRFFAKIVGVSNVPLSPSHTTHDIITLHKALVDESLAYQQKQLGNYIQGDIEAEKSLKFWETLPKEVLGFYPRPSPFKDLLQPQKYTIKPLAAALIIVIEDRIGKDHNFEAQMVRVVRTGIWIAPGFSYILKWAGLTIKEYISEHEVTTTLGEAIRWVMMRERIEEAVRVKVDPPEIDRSLGLPVSAYLETFA
jgi:hypothetical protein